MNPRQQPTTLRNRAAEARRAGLAVGIRASLGPLRAALTVRVGSTGPRRGGGHNGGHMLLTRPDACRTCREVKGWAR